MVTSCSVQTKELKKSLSRIKRFNPNYFKSGIVKIRMMPGGIELSTIGIFEVVPGYTQGLAEVYVPLKLIYAFTKTYTNEEITFTFRTGEMECGSSIFSYPEIKVETWYNTPDVDLSMRPRDFELLKMGYLNLEKVKQYNLHKEYLNAKNKMDKTIRECHGMLELYEIKKEDIEELIVQKFLLKS